MEADDLTATIVKELTNPHRSADHVVEIFRWLAFTEDLHITSVSDPGSHQPHRARNGINVRSRSRELAASSLSADGSDGGVHQHGTFPPGKSDVLAIRLGAAAENPDKAPKECPGGTWWSPRVWIGVPRDAIQEHGSIRFTTTGSAHVPDANVARLPTQGSGLPAYCSALARRAANRERRSRHRTPAWHHCHSTSTHIGAEAVQPLDCSRSSTVYPILSSLRSMNFSSCMPISSRSGLMLGTGWRLQSG
jgi:hypothetical protein